MDLTWLLITAFIVGASGALVPGPMLTYTIGASIAKGWSAGFRIAAGHAVLEIALVATLLLGLQSVLASESVKSVIGLAGGMVLLWLGVNILRQSSKNTLHFDGQNSNIDIGFGQNPVIGGAVVSIANPHFIVWWATIGAAYLAYSIEYGLIGIGVFMVGHLLSDFLWYGTVSILIAKGRDHIKSGVYQFVLIACGLFLIALAVYFIVDGHLNLCITKAL